MPAAAARAATSSRCGYDGWQPSRSTEIAAVTRASCTACSSGVPAAMPAHTAPANASPAPVVSTERAGTAGSSVPRGQQDGARGSPRQHDTRGQMPGERVQLGLVDDRDVELPDDLGVDRVGRRWIDDRGGAVGACGRDGALMRGARHLARAEPDRGSAGIRRAGHAVRAGQREYLVLTLLVDRDQRDAAVHPRDHGERRDVDALVGERAADEVAELVVAARAEEAHAHAQPRGGHGDIGPLAAGREQEAVAEYRLARLREPRRIAEHVGADRSAHGDEAAHAAPARVCARIGQAYRQLLRQRYRASVEHEAPKIVESSNPIMRRWEALPGVAQFCIVFPIWFLVFWVGHVKLLNQPVFLRGFLYGLFWGLPFSLLTLLATRSEQAKRYLREHPEEQDVH